jgi:hypothetical protein
MRDYRSSNKTVAAKRLRRRKSERAFALQFLHHIRLFAGYLSAEDDASSRVVKGGVEPPHSMPKVALVERPRRF